MAVNEFCRFGAYLELLTIIVFLTYKKLKVTSNFLLSVMLVKVPINV